MGKTWVLLEFAVSIVTGRPAFDRYEVASPGPVIVVLEESGELRCTAGSMLSAVVTRSKLAPSPSFTSPLTGACG